MKRPVILTFAIIFAVAAVIVLGLLISSLTGRFNMGNLFNFGELTAGELIKEETFDASSLSELSISTSEQKVMFYLTDDDVITVKQYDYSDADEFTATLRGGALDIKTGSKIRISIMNFTIPVFEVYIPREYAGNVSAYVSSGGIRCDELVRWNDVSLESKSGSIRFEQGIDCSSLTADSSSGTVRFEKIISAGNVSLKATSGSIRIEGVIECSDFYAKSSSGTVALSGGVAASGKVEIECNSGSIRTDKITSTEYAIKASSGSIRLEGLRGMGTVNSSSGGVTCNALTVTGDTHIKSSSGSVSVTLVDSKNIKIEAQTGSGSIKADNLDLSYDSSGKQAFCTIGDGSTGTLSLRASSGSVRIH